MKSSFLREPKSLSSKEVSVRNKKFITTNLTKDTSETRMKTAMDNDLYEDELYFISQIFEENWQPRGSVIDFDEGTIYDVKLREHV
jgi:hypothetical protein